MPNPNLLWIIVIVLATSLGTVEVRRLATGTMTVGSPLMIVNAVLFVLAATIEIITEPTAITGRVSLILILLGAAAGFLGQILNGRARRRNHA